MASEPTRTEVSSRPRRQHLWIICGLALAAIGGGVVWSLSDPQRSMDERARDKAPVKVPPVEPPKPAVGPALFRDMTAKSGLQFTYRNGETADSFTLLEVMGGGVGLIDYDGDGRLDVFVTGGGYFEGAEKKQIKGYPCKLYRNLGGWKFQDVTAQVGLDRVAWLYTGGVAVADYDCDGWPDLLVTGYGGLALFHNESDGKGGRRFVDVTQTLGLGGDQAWCTSAGWADIDGDGFPDLYVCRYVDWSLENDPKCDGQYPGIKRDVCPPLRFKPLMHALFHNDKGKGFRDISAEHSFRADGRGLGVVLADFNADGRPDIYVANDASNNALYFNRNGKLAEVGMEAGAAVDDNGHYNASMGIDVGDFDGSGRASLWVTNYQGELHGLYRNGGKEDFRHCSRDCGLGALGLQYVGFGTGFLDVNNDGWQDIIAVNGHVMRHPGGGSTLKQLPVLLLNTERGSDRGFVDIGRQGGEFFKSPAIGRGVAIGDLDNDGWPDVVVSHTNAPVVLLRNEARATQEKPSRWLGIRLVGKSHRDVVGSTVVVDAGSRKLTRFAKGGGSYLSAGDSRILFGLGSIGQIDSITVRWSWGKTETWKGLAPDAHWELREGEPEARRLAAPTD